MKQLQIISLALLFITLNACKEDNDPAPQLSGADILVGSMVMNTATYDGRTYLQLLDDVKGQTIDNSSALPVSINFPKYHGEDVYVFPAYVGKADNKLIKYTRKDGQLLETGALPLQTNSSATNLVFASDTKAYLSMAGLGKVWVINPQTMTKTGEIDLTHLAVGDNNPDPGAMLLRDDLLFVGLNQMGPNFIPAHDRPYSDVAIIDTKKDEFLKVIIEKQSGLSCPTRPIAEKSIFIDEKNDIYILCIGGFGVLPNHKSGLLRIKSGETEFDTSFSWDFSKQAIIGDPYKSTMIQTVKYAGNGKLFAYCLIPEYKKASDENIYTAFANIAVEIDLYNKTVKKIEAIPLSNSYAMGIYDYKEDVIFCNYSQNASGLFQYSPQSKQVDQVLTTAGFATTFHYFGK